MPRIPRYFLETSFFHVITQGINKSFIFKYHADIKEYISIMYKLEEEQQVEIIAYCIMNNHAHILLKIENIKELTKYMHRLNTTYGLYYNKKYDRVGYVFRDRYKCEGIYSEEQLYNCIAYIYNNPIKANLCEKIEDYPYTNYKEAFNKTNIESDDSCIFLDVDEDKAKTCKRVVERFLKENELDLKELKSHKEKLRELLILLRENYKIPWRKIEGEIKIGRETIRYLCKY